jgi:hypothetical protein
VVFGCFVAEHEKRVAALHTQQAKTGMARGSGEREVEETSGEG